MSKDPKLCNTAYCRNKRRKGRKDCSTCNKKKWRNKYPMKAVFQTLRQNARRRGKVFKISFSQFEKFCYETKYLAGVGRSRKSFSIDRIDNDKGYTADNIRMVTKSENSRKGTKVLVYDWRTNYATVI